MNALRTVAASPLIYRRVPDAEFVRRRRTTTMSAPARDRDDFALMDTAVRAFNSRRRGNAGRPGDILEAGKIADEIGELLR